MDNKQQLLYIQSLFGSFHGLSQFVNVTDRVDGREYKLEIYPSNGLVAYRLHINEDSTTLWSTWDDPDHVETYFNTASFL